MSSPRMRPMFDLPLATNAEGFYERLQAASSGDKPVQMNLFEDGGAVLRLMDRDHVWSPSLHLRVAETDGEFLLRGRFCPSSPVWTAFLGAYLAISCIGIAATCWGISQWLVGHTPWALLGVPISLGLAGFTYGAAFIGQGLSSEDMHILRSHVERVASAKESGPES